jgi:hypothetical protein
LINNELSFIDSASGSFENLANAFWKECMNPFWQIAPTLSSFEINVTFSRKEGKVEKGVGGTMSVLWKIKALATESAKVSIEDWVNVDS